MTRVLLPSCCLLLAPSRCHRAASAAGWRAGVAYKTDLAGRYRKRTCPDARQPSPTRRVNLHGAVGSRRYAEEGIACMA